MLRHVKQKAPPPPPPPCNVIGTISVPVSNGEEKHNRAQIENSDDGSTLSTHTLTKQNLDPGSAVPACLCHSHSLKLQMNSFNRETSNQVCHIATLWYKRPLMLIILNSQIFILKIRNNTMKRD